MEIRRPNSRDALVAAAIFVLGVCIYLLDLDLVIGGDRETPIGWRLAILFVACVGTLLRRVYPVLALALVIGAAVADLTRGLSLPVVIAFVDVLFVASLDGSRRLHRALVALVAVATLGLTLTVAALSDDWRQSFYAGLQMFSLVVVPVWWATNVRRHRESAEQVARIAELDRRAAVDAERARMARDLHDVIAGHLSAIAIQSEAVLSMPADSETVRTVLKSVRENSLRSLDEMRTMIDVLRADEPADEPVAVRLADARRLVDSARAGGLGVDFASDSVVGLPVAVDVAAYRILQESLTNALKHGSSATVRVERQVRRLVLVVRNTVTQHVEGSGTGLVSMAERAHTVGGTFAAGRDGAEWVVRAELPL